MKDLIIPEKLFKELNLSPIEFKIDIAAYLYDKERLTMGQAKKFAGLNQIQFQKELSKRNIYIKYDIEDLEKDLETLSLLY